MQTLDVQFLNFCVNSQVKHLFVQCMELLSLVSFTVFLLQEAFDKKAKTKIQDFVGKTDLIFF